jgi:hypothetical protein
MGYEADCTLRIQGRSARGTARLEHKDLVFRGPFRLAIPLADVRQATADGNTLTIRYGADAVELDIGDAAARWAQRIISPPSRLQKLGIKQGMRVVLIGIADRTFRQEVASGGAEVAARPAGADIVFLGVERASDLDRLRPLAAAIAPDGAVWVVRRKGPAAAVSERDSMAAGKRAGLVDVKVVAFSETHTAEKYVIPRNARPRAVKPARPDRPAPARRTHGSAPSRART